MTTPLDTWVLDTPTQEGTLFAEWFNVESPNTNLRVIIHRDTGPPLPGLWPWSYRCGSFRIQRRRGKYANIKRVAIPFLYKMLDAYRDGTYAVENVIQQTNHRYWLGRVVPDPALYQEV
ncbi:MAG: hypothetical protein IH984_06945 [Planctomycetes bacterium]|nr:hypothetical protein [Planctomycetota bacterium]